MPNLSRTRRPRVRPGRTVGDRVLPSSVLAENISAYRGLRHITQDELAARMTLLGHDMSRSTVSAIEGNGRNVTVDELFALAISIGVTIGQMLDPTGPENTRDFSLDVGLTSASGGSLFVPPVLGHLWAASQAVIRRWHVDEEAVEFDVAPDLSAAAQRAMDELRSNAPVRLSPP